MEGTYCCGSLSAGERWKASREAAGFSAAKAADAAGVHENTIYLLENDKKNDGVTVRLCKQVADVYGVSLAEIFSDPQTVERVPSELRPLQELLRPLDTDARVSFVRNVVSNARFMAQLIATGDGLSTGEARKPYSSASNAIRRDEPHEGVVLLSAGESEAETQAARTEATAPHGRTARQNR